MRIPPQNPATGVDHRAKRQGRVHIGLHRQITQAEPDPEGPLPSLQATVNHRGGTYSSSFRGMMRGLAVMNDHVASNRQGVAWVTGPTGLASRSYQTRSGSASFCIRGVWWFTRQAGSRPPSGRNVQSTLLCGRPVAPQGLRDPTGARVRGPLDNAPEKKWAVLPMCTEWGQRIVKMPASRPRHLVARWRAPVCAALRFLGAQTHTDPLWTWPS
jgi:hypothetical protein